MVNGHTEKEKEREREIQQMFYLVRKIYLHMKRNKNSNSNKQCTEMEHPVVNMMECQWKLRQQHHLTL